MNCLTARSSASYYDLQSEATTTSTVNEITVINSEDDGHETTTISNGSVFPAGNTKLDSPSKESVVAVRGLGIDCASGGALIRRAFSSKRRKKRKPLQPPCADTLLVAGEFLMPPLGQCPSRAHSSEFLTPSSAIEASNSQSDLTLRKSVFSRKSYGSSDMLNAIEAEGLSNNAGTFRVESGEYHVTAPQAFGGNTPSPSPIHVENPEFQTRWYFKYFLGRPHQNFVGADSDRKEPFILSFIVNDSNAHQYKAILWRKHSYQKISLPCASGKSLTAKQILAHFDITKFEYGPKEVHSPEIQGSLLQLEEQEGSLDYKFGVIYAKEGQNCDDQMYSNEFGSPEFENFVALLGDRIEVKGWTRFRAGLDATNGTTGDHSIYTVYEGHEIMWHVSTLLPYTADNRQQVERKRHVGNDIVNVVFVEEAPDKNWSDSCVPSWRPCMMKTHFTHIFAVVHYIRERDAYRLAIYSHKDVPLFGPPLPTPAEFTDRKEFREFLLVKLINGEKASFNIPVFAQKREKSIEMLIKSIVDQYYGDVQKTPLISRKSMSEIFAEQSSYQQARQMEFVKVGQTLKLRTILKGDAPTSLVTSSVIRREPWQPHTINCEVNSDVLSGDSWGDKLVLSTSRGLLLIDEKDSSPRMLIDSSVTFREMVIIEIYGLLIGLPERGKKLYIVPLSALDAVLRTRSQHMIAGNTSQTTGSLSCSCACTSASTGALNGQNARPTSTSCDAAAATVFANSTVSIPISTDCCATNSVLPPAEPLTRTFSSPGNGNGNGNGSTSILDKDSLKSCKLQRSKGCQSFCISKPFSNPLQLLVCVGKRLLLFLWKSTILNASSLSNWNQFQESNVESTFHLVREFVLTDQPEVHCFVDGPKRATRICVGYRNQFDLLDELGEVLQTFKIDSSVKATLTPAIGLCADDEAELLLTYNNTSRFQKMNGSNVSELEFKWSSMPQHVICAFPYIIGFSSDTIEIRLIINGNLIYSRNLPNLQLFTAKCDVFFGTSALFVNGLNVPSSQSSGSHLSASSAGSFLSQGSTPTTSLPPYLPSPTGSSGVFTDSPCSSAAPVVVGSGTGSGSGISTGSGNGSNVTNISIASKVTLSSTKSIKFGPESAAAGTGVASGPDYTARRIALYRIPLACLTAMQCSLEKTRLVANAAPNNTCPPLIINQSERQTNVSHTYNAQV